MPGSFELVLFSSHTDTVQRATAAGMDGFIVDWERRGKTERQSGSDTEISLDTPDDLRRVRAATTQPIICRINVPDERSAEEVEEAIASGTDEILVPMVRSPHDVDAILRQVRGRCDVGVLIETPAAVAIAADFARLPLSRVYVGLNDLAIARGSSSIFEAVLDGTVERLRHHFDIPFGFGGLTVPDSGAPVPSRLLMGEMTRLGTTFSFLRRSFRRDIVGRSMADGIRQIREALAESRARNQDDVERDRRDFRAAVLAVPLVSR